MVDFRYSISVFERSLSMVPCLTSVQWVSLMYPWLEVNSPLDHHLTVRETSNHLDPHSYLEKLHPYPGASFVTCDPSGPPAEKFGGVSGALLRLQDDDTKLKVPECARDKF